MAASREQTKGPTISSDAMQRCGTSDMSPKATVVITTKSRRDDLRVALASVASQTVPVEVIVIDDGSTDGTAEMVRDEFPGVRLERNAISTGYIVARNRAARLATTDVIVSIDDDAALSTDSVIEQTLADFDHPRIGAVAIPYREPRKSDALFQSPPDRQGRYVTDVFIGTAHALLRDTFLELGGYRECLVHQGEEGDYCVRMLNAGFVTRLGRADPVIHYESPQRDLRRMDLHGRRNDILFAWHNVPYPYLPLHLAATSSNGIISGIRVGRPLRMLRGTLAGYLAAARRWSCRQPVEPRTYRLSRRLKKAGPLRFDAVEALLDGGLRSGGMEPAERRQREESQS